MSDPHEARLDRRSGPAERDYLLRRAEDHRRRADASAEAGVQALHARFARLYRAQAASLTADRAG